MEELNFYNFENHSLLGHVFYLFKVHSHNIHSESTFFKYYKYEKNIFFVYVAISHVTIYI